MIITNSLPLKKFKKEVGQANHMLITILVGLDEIIDSDVQINKEFHAAWNPNDKKKSANRGKDFAKKSSMSWVVDCIDMYLHLINKSPSLVGNYELKQILDSEANNHSIYKKLSIISKFYGIESELFALADLLICWRNRLSHYDAENDISSPHKEILVKAKDNIKLKYRGLDIEKTLESFNKNQSPTFKEAASLISASIDLVYAIDRILVEKLDKTDYADQVIMNFFKKDPKKRLNEVFSNEKDKVYKSLRQILAHNSFSFSTEDDENEVDNLCLDISKLEYTEIKERYKLGSLFSKKTN